MSGKNISINQIKDLDKLSFYLKNFGELNIEDNNIVLNYSETGNTSTNGVGAGFTIQDGGGEGKDVSFKIRPLDRLFGNRLKTNEYSGSEGYNNLGFVSELNDIVLGNTSNRSMDGFRVIKENDIVNGGSIGNESTFSGSNRTFRYILKSTDYSGVVPTVEDLIPGELAVNIKEGKLYTLKGTHNSYEVVEFTGISIKNFSTTSTTMHSNNEDGTLTVDTGLSYVGGEYITITYPEDITNIQTAIVTDYTGDQLSFTHVSNNGNKLNFDNWIIDIGSEPSNSNFSTTSTTMHSNNEDGTLTVDTGLSYVAGEYVSITYPEDITNIQIGTVTEYVGDQLSFTHVSNNGNKLNFDNWIIDITSTPIDEPTTPTIQNLIWTSPEGDSQQYEYPAYGYYDYGQTMFIIRASELGSDNKIIHGLEIEMGGYSTPYTYYNQTIKIAHTSDLEFGDNVKTDLTNINNVSNLTTVKGGFDWTITSSGYQTIDFDTNFEFNGDDSLIIIWENNDSDWGSGFGYAKCHFDNTYVESWYKHQDHSYPSSSYGTKDLSYRPNFKIKY